MSRKLFTLAAGVSAVLRGNDTGSSKDSVPFGLPVPVGLRKADSGGLAGARECE